MTALIIPPIEIKPWQPTTVQKIRSVDLDVEHGDDDMKLRVSTVCRVGGFETMVAEVYEDASGFEVLDELELEGHASMIEAIMFHREAVRRYTVVSCRCCHGAGGWGDADCPAECVGGLIYQGKLEALERALNVR